MIWRSVYRAVGIDRRSRKQPHAATEDLGTHANLLPHVSLEVRTERNTLQLDWPQLQFPHETNHEVRALLGLKGPPPFPCPLQRVPEIVLAIFQ